MHAQADETWTVVEKCSYKSEAAAMFKTILMATDGSPAVERLLVFTEHLARRSQAQVVVVHAYSLPKTYEWTEGYAELDKQYRQVADEVVKDAQEALEKGGINATSEVREGPAPEVILDVARLYEVDLIVMGSRAKSRENVAEALLGSVSSAVLRHTYCPTLLIP
jgi:nucleotide-binding universal stress UspA family protein